MNLAERHGDILACGDPQRVLVEFQQLQVCMIETTQAMNRIQLQSRASSTRQREEKTKTRSFQNIRLHSKELLDVIPECISVDDTSSHSDDPLTTTIQLRRTEEIHPVIWKQQDDPRPDSLQQESDQSTVLSSSCSSIDGGMSVRNIVHQLKTCRGADLSLPVFLECIDDWCLKDDVRSVEFAASGGIPAIIHAMRATNSHPDLQAKLCETLKYLASNSSNLPLIAVVGGIHAVFAAMSKYPNNAKIQTIALGTLKHLCDFEGTADEIMLADGVEAILSAMHRHRDQVALQKHACSVLEALDWIEVDAFAVSVLFECIQRHTREGQLQSHALKVLRLILDKNVCNEETSGIRMAIEEMLTILGRRIFCRAWTFLKL